MTEEGPDRDRGRGRGRGGNRGRARGRGRGRGRGGSSGDHGVDNSQPSKRPWRGKKPTRGVRRKPAREANQLSEPSRTKASDDDIFAQDKSPAEVAAAKNQSTSENEEDIVENKEKNEDEDEVVVKGNEEEEDEEDDDDDDFDISAFLTKQLTLGSSSAYVKREEEISGDVETKQWKRLNKNTKQSTRARPGNRDLPHRLTVEEVKKDSVMAAKVEKEKHVTEIKQRLRQDNSRRSRASQKLKQPLENTPDAQEIDDFLESTLSSNSATPKKQSTYTWNTQSSQTPETETAAKPTHLEMEEFLDSVLKDPSGTFGRRRT